MAQSNSGRARRPETDGSARTPCMHAARRRPARRRARPPSGRTCAAIAGGISRRRALDQDDVPRGALRPAGGERALRQDHAGRELGERRRARSRAAPASSSSAVTCAPQAASTARRSRCRRRPPARSRPRAAAAIWTRRAITIGSIRHAAAAERHVLVGIGERRERRRHEALARQVAHGLEDAGVGDLVGPHLAVHHVAAGVVEVEAGLVSCGRSILQAMRRL